MYDIITSKKTTQTIVCNMILHNTDYFHFKCILNYVSNYTHTSTHNDITCVANKSLWSQWNITAIGEEQKISDSERGSDVTEQSEDTDEATTDGLNQHHYNSNLPLPSTEEGTTLLVTTKTVQAYQCTSVMYGEDHMELV